MAIKLIVYMEPVPKARAKPYFNKKSNKMHSYTPTKTVDAENMIRMAFMASGQKKIEGKVPLKITINCYINKPKSTKKSVIYPVTRPDVDNYQKLVFDALNKYAFEDDSQIILSTVSKTYSDTPRIEIYIKELEETENKLYRFKFEEGNLVICPVCYIPTDIKTAHILLVDVKNDTIKCPECEFVVSYKKCQKDGFGYIGALAKREIFRKRLTNKEVKNGENI